MDKVQLNVNFETDLFKNQLNLTLLHTVSVNKVKLRFTIVLTFDCTFNS